MRYIILVLFLVKIALSWKIKLGKKSPSLQFPSCHSSSNDIPRRGGDLLLDSLRRVLFASVVVGAGSVAKAKTYFDTDVYGDKELKIGKYFLDYAYS